MVLGRTEKASGWGERLAHPTTRPPTSWSMGGAGWTKHPPSQAVGHFKAPNLGGGGLWGHGPITTASPDPPGSTVLPAATSLSSTQPRSRWEEGSRGEG